MTAGTTDVTWTWHLLGKLYEHIEQYTLFYDNQSAVNIAFNPVMLSQTKHTEIHIHSCDQVVALFTNELTHRQFWFFEHKLYMIRVHVQFEGGC